MKRYLISILLCVIAVLVILIAYVTLADKIKRIDAEVAKIALLPDFSYALDKLPEEEESEPKQSDVAQDLEPLGQDLEPIEEEPEPAAILTDEERDLIERVVAAEARGESFEGMMAVAQCIKDRGDLWQKSYGEIASAPGQFASPYQGDVPEQVKQAVSDVFDCGQRVTESPITHFYNPAKCDPDWAETKTIVCEIGGHRFLW